ncbi:MAG: hypothetical protein OEW21_17765 [Betaproteobacteria bacterium]|nr:hypothetical protein [Betaproteobacteria bacterium]
MNQRQSEKDVTNRVNVENASDVREAIAAILAARYPGEDLSLLKRVFDDVESLFEGRLPGYLSCDTPYHDLRHTLDVTLALARLVDGHDRVRAEADRLGARRAQLGIIIALLHDSGYVKRASEAGIANGAVFTKVHVSRGAEFIADYLPKIGFGPEVEVAKQIVHFTGYEMNLEDIKLGEPKDRLLGTLIGTADLIGQMSDRTYLEKVRDFLYHELVWGEVARETTPDGGQIVRYASAEDLVSKTPEFFELARDRVVNKLGGVHRYAGAHFDGANPYLVEIDRNMKFLRDALRDGDLARLRRICRSLSRLEEIEHR